MIVSVFAAEDPLGIPRELAGEGLSGGKFSAFSMSRLVAEVLFFSSKGERRVGEAFRGFFERFLEDVRSKSGESVPLNLSSSMLWAPGTCTGPSDAKFFCFVFFKFLLLEKPYQIL